MTIESIHTLLQIQKLDPKHTELTSPLSLNIFNNDKGRSLFLNSTKDIGTVALLEFLPSAGVRGNHYHLNKSETLYVIFGKMKLYYWIPNESEIKETIVEGGDLITIKPNLAHAYIAIEPTLAFEVGSLPYNPADTVYDQRITKES
jgi:quercetin dioxygenase-like cupin family protein